MSVTVLNIKNFSEFNLIFRKSIWLLLVVESVVSTKKTFTYNSLIIYLIKYLAIILFNNFKEFNNKLLVLEINFITWTKNFFLV